MVERGQVLERMTLVRSSDCELEALFASGTAPGDPGLPVVLAGPHPRFGGNMDSPVLAELVWALAAARRPTLRFNWRGVGASQGETAIPPLPASAPPDLAAEAADLEAAIEQHAPNGPCALVGYSFGAAVAALVGARHPRVERLALIAPLVGMLPHPWDALERSGVPVLVVCGDEDIHAAPAAVEADLARRFPVRAIAGATHSFQRGLPELARLVAAAI